MSTDNRLGNLSNVFAGGSPRKRLADLPDVADAARPAPERSPLAAVPAPPEQTPTSSAASAAPRADTPPKRRPKDAAATAVRTTSISIPIHLSDAITDALASAAAGERLTSTEVILTAVEANVDRLPALVRDERTTPAEGSAVFPDPKTNIRAVGEQRVIRALSTTQANLDVIDALAKKAGAASRSQLITAALRAYLMRA